MNNFERNQENKTPQGQGGRTEETREGRETMRGANSDSGHRNFSAREREEEDEDFDDMEDTDEASLDDASEDEDEMDLEGTERSDLGFNRGDRDDNRERSNQI